jgi:cytochrome c551
MKWFHPSYLFSSTERLDMKTATLLSIITASAAIVGCTLKGSDVKSASPTSSSTSTTQDSSSKTSDSSSSEFFTAGSGSSSSGSDASAGRQIFNTNCARCHRLDGGRGRGPDLSSIGSKRSADWIADHVRDPKSHNKNSGMPKFDRMGDDDLKTLAGYLAGLKG